MNRTENLKQLREKKRFDLLVIGGGATGCGVALEAASRGLQVALVEQNDFAEGTSGRSTKLVHGGVRYLERAVRRLDPAQYHLVRDALHERSTLMKNAPHLANRLALVTPLYHWHKVPYVYSGLKLYDLLAGRHNIGHSRLLGRREALRRFPTLKAKGLKAGVLYYDGQFHDARMALSLALTAARHGAIISNHVAVSALLKKERYIVGAELTDSLTGERWQLHAKGVINATGPFADQLRQMDEPGTGEILSVSSGIHIVLDGRFAPPDTGLLIPETEDGRVLFVLPWEGHALVGTTDEVTTVSEHPRPREAEIDYLLRHLGRYFNLQVDRSDIRAVWSGLRPLVADPKRADTAGLARDHVIETSASGLLTIVGGKWTTYRRMAQDAVDHALREFDLFAPIATSRTAPLRLVGGERYREKDSEALSADTGIPAEMASYLLRSYGDQARQVADLDRTLLRPLAEGLPIPEVAVLQAVRHELAERIIDVLARRTPLALLNTAAARRATSRVLEIMTSELGWGKRRQAAELALTELRLNDGL
ncbi:MAG: glycerol-3-phosphate dehydrogenase [Desulfuromonas sp.]|nr:MAG: glycerol-3-phosphate dehydrogenase [Desulfuromonas sp.]